MKKIILFVSTICLAVLLIAVGIWLAKSSNSETEQPPFVVDPVQENDKLRLSTKRYVDNRTGETGVTVNAIVNPSSVVNDKLTWTLEWSQISSENVFDYVTMNVSADTHSVTLVYKKNFNTQLVLKATSVQIPSVSATCSVDCYKRTSDFAVDFSFEIDGEYQSMTVDETNKTIDFGVVTYANLNSVLLDDLVTEDAIQIGTIDTISSTTRKLVFSEELKRNLTSTGVTFTNTLVDISELVGKSIQEIINMFVDSTTNNRDDIYYALSSSDCWFNLEITVIDTYNDVEINRLTKTYMLIEFDISDGMFVTNIDLDKSNIIF